MPFVQAVPFTWICRTVAFGWSEMLMSMLAFRVCLLPPGSFSFEIVITWEGADRSSRCDPANSRG